MIKLENLDKLKKSKNLLAFSYGSDSTALFYLLMQENIEFDCALVNYQTRISSDDEEKDAKKLCAIYNKKFFSKKIRIQKGNFESLARDERYNFFLELATKHGYNALIFAHQLNDYFEWFLLSLKRGAGLANLLGFNESFKGLDIFRPLKYTPKDEILNFLKENNIKYFFDSSNNDEKFTRNFIRKNFSDDFVRYATNGLITSFKALNDDKKALLADYIYKNNEIFIFKNSTCAINLADKTCKILGVVLSKKQRELLQNTLNSNGELVISHKIAFCVNENFVFICPYHKEIMPKKFKEKCRILKIPNKIRSYLFLHNDDFNAVCKILT